MNKYIKESWNIATNLDFDVTGGVEDAIFAISDQVVKSSSGVSVSLTDNVKIRNGGTNVNWRFIDAYIYAHSGELLFLPDSIVGGQSTDIIINPKYLDAYGNPTDEFYVLVDDAIVEAEMLSSMVSNKAIIPQVSRTQQMTRINYDSQLLDPYWVGYDEGLTGGALLRAKDRANRQTYTNFIASLDANNVEEYLLESGVITNIPLMSTYNVRYRSQGQSIIIEVLDEPKQISNTAEYTLDGSLIRDSDSSLSFTDTETGLEWHYGFIPQLKPGETPLAEDLLTNPDDFLNDQEFLLVLPRYSEIDAAEGVVDPWVVRTKIGAETFSPSDTPKYYPIIIESDGNSYLAWEQRTGVHYEDINPLDIPEQLHNKLIGYGITSPSPVLINAEDIDVIEFINGINNYNANSFDVYTRLDRADNPVGVALQNKIADTEFNRIYGIRDSIVSMEFDDVTSLDIEKFTNTALSNSFNEMDINGNYILFPTVTDIESRLDLIQLFCFGDIEINSGIVDLPLYEVVFGPDNLVINGKTYLLKDMTLDNIMAIPDDNLYFFIKNHIAGSLIGDAPNTGLYSNFIEAGDAVDGDVIQWINTESWIVLASDQWDPANVYQPYYGLGYQRIMYMGDSSSLNSLSGLFEYVKNNIIQYTYELKDLMSVVNKFASGLSGDAKAMFSEEMVKLSELMKKLDKDTSIDNIITSLGGKPDSDIVPVTISYNSVKSSNAASQSLINNALVGPDKKGYFGLQLKNGVNTVYDPASGNNFIAEIEIPSTGHLAEDIGGRATQFTSTVDQYGQRLDLGKETTQPSIYFKKVKGEWKLVFSLGNFGPSDKIAITMKRFLSMYANIFVVNGVPLSQRKDAMEIISHLATKGSLAGYVPSSAAGEIKQFSLNEAVMESEGMMKIYDAFLTDGKVDFSSNALGSARKSWTFEDMTLGEMIQAYYFHRGLEIDTYTRVDYRRYNPDGTWVDSLKVQEKNGFYIVSGWDNNKEDLLTIRDLYYRQWSASLPDTQWSNGATDIDTILKTNIVILSGGNWGERAIGSITPLEYFDNIILTSYTNGRYEFFLRAADVGPITMIIDGNTYIFRTLSEAWAYTVPINLRSLIATYSSNSDGIIERMQNNGLEGLTSLFDGKDAEGISGWSLEKQLKNGYRIPAGRTAEQADKFMEEMWSIWPSSFFGRIWRLLGFTADLSLGWHGITTFKVIESLLELWRRIDKSLPGTTPH